MKRRSFLLVMGGLFAAKAAVAQTTAETPAAPTAPAADAPLSAPEAGWVRVNMQTREGLIVIDLAEQKAPITAGNFLRYVAARRLDGTTLYRAVHPPGITDYGSVQGGVRDPAKQYPVIKHEPTTTTGLSHTEGAISMGRFAPGTARSDFFICVGDQSRNYDADPSKSGDNAGYAAFGKVVSGMDVVKRILAMPISATEGGALKGSILEKPVPVNTVRRAV